MGTTAKGVASGLATLDSSGKLTTAQIPTALAGLTQGVAVTDVVALTSSAPAALTSAQITGGESPTEAEHNAVQADLAALRTTLTAVRTDASNIRTTLLALQNSLQAAGTIAP